MSVNISLNQKSYLLKDKSAQKLFDLISVDHVCSDKPSCLIIENGIILPWKKDTTNKFRWGKGGVLNSEGNFVAESGDINYGGNYEFDKNLVEESLNEEVIYLGFMKDHWGVFLSDVLRRLYYYFKNSGKKIVLIGFGFDEGTYGRIDKQVGDLLDILNISRDSIIDVRKPTRFKRIYIPELGFTFNTSIYKDYIIPYSIASKNVYDSKFDYPEKIYLSRTLFAQNKEVGEKAIENIFRENQFQIIYPEKLSIAEQIQIVSNAKVIASIEGTVAHNILFCNSGTEQIIIKKQSWLNPRQFLFNQVTETKVTYIDCYKEPYKAYPKSYDEGPFLILITNEFRKFLMDRNFVTSRNWIFNNCFYIIKYTAMCIKMNLRKSYKKIPRILKHSND